MDDFEKLSLDFTNGQGVDVIYDSVGRSTFIKGIKVLKKKGRIVSFGFSSGKIEPIDINQLFVCLASKWRSLDLLGLGSKRKVGGSPKKYHLYRT